MAYDVAAGGAVGKFPPFALPVIEAGIDIAYELSLAGSFPGVRHKKHLRSLISCLRRILCGRAYDVVVLTVAIYPDSESAHVGVVCSGGSGYGRHVGESEVFVDLYFD